MDLGVLIIYIAFILMAIFGVVDLFALLIIYNRLMAVFLCVLIIYNRLMTGFFVAMIIPVRLGLCVCSGGFMSLLRNRYMNRSIRYVCRFVVRLRLGSSSRISFLLSLKEGCNLLCLNLVVRIQFKFHDQNLFIRKFSINNTDYGTIL